MVGSGKTVPSGVVFRPATGERWKDLVTLFGPKGACAGCWCMFWRQSGAEYTSSKGDGNRRALKALTSSSRAPGILAYAGETVAGWCAVAPRTEYTRLARSRVLKPLDAQPVWSIVCFFVARPFRRQGLTVALLKAALEFARANGAHIVEGYPVEPRDGSMPDVFAYTGLASAFRRAGFEEVARRSSTRPFMRCDLESTTRGRKPTAVGGRKGAAAPGRARRSS